MKVSGIKIVNGGVGYESAPVITFSGGDGDYAEAIAEVERGKVTNVRVTNGGGGYTEAPKLNFVGGGGKGASAIVEMG